LSNLDLFVLSSSSEGFSIATIEAMAAGVPVVATRSGGPEEIIEDQVDGCLVETGSPIALADGILDCLNDSTRAKSMARSAKAKVRNQFSLESMKEQYFALYNKLLEE
jgi:glycosyltransferase involved in cell wall biosynthesis